MTQDLYYYESGYLTPDSGYFTYNADAESIQSSSFTATVTAGNIKNATLTLTNQFTQSANVSTIKQGISSLTSQFTQVSIISHINGADLFAMSNASIEVTISRLRDNNTDVSSVFNIAVSGQRIRYINSEEDSSFEINIDNLRVRYDEAAIDAAFSLDSNPTKIIQGNSEQYTQLDINIDGTRLRFNSSELTTQTELSADIEKIPGGTIIEASGDWYTEINAEILSERFAGLVSSLDCIFDQSITEDYIRYYSASLISAVEQEINNERYRDNNIELTTSATINAHTYNIKQFDIALTDAFIPTLTIDIFKNSFAILDISSNISASSIIIANGSADLLSNYSQDSLLDRIRYFESNQNITSSISVDISKIIDNSSSLDIESTISIENYRIVQFSSIEYSAFNPSITCTITKNSLSSLNVNASLSIAIDIIKVANATIVSNASLSAGLEANKLLNSSITSIAQLSAIGYSLKYRPRQSTIVGSPTFTTTRQLGSHALSFPQPSYVNVSPTTEFNIAANEEFNISFFYKPSGISGTTVLAQLIDASTSNVIWKFSQTTNILKFEYWDGSTLQSVTYTGASTNNWNWARVYRTYGTRLCIEIHSYNGSTWTATGTNDTSGYRSFSGAITRSSLARLQIGNIVSGSSATVIIDEFYIARGTNAISTIDYYTRPATDLTVGRLDTTEVLFHFNNNYIDDMIGTAYGASALISSASITAKLTGVSNQAASLNITSNVSSTALKIKQIDSNITAEGFLVAATGRIRPFIDLEVATFTLNASGNVITSYSTSLISTTTIACDITKILGPVTADLTSYTSLISQPVITTETVAYLEVDAFELVVDTRIRAEVAELISAFTISIVANKTRESIVNINSTATTNIQIRRIAGLSADINSSTILIADTIHTIPFISTENSEFTFNCTGNRIRNIASQVNSQTNLNSQIKANKTLSCDLNSNFALVTVNSRQRNLSSNLIAFVTELTLGNNTRAVSADLQVASSLSALISIIGGRVTADLSIITNLGCTAERIRTVQTNMSIVIAIDANAGKLAVALAHLTCEGFILSTGKVFDLNASEIWVIPKEITSWKIASESNDWIISKEITSWRIAKETNIWGVVPEDRNYIIKD